jgi:hypothetical protein
MDSLTLSGLLAVTLMLVFYALEDRSPWFRFRRDLCARLGLRLPSGGVAIRRDRGDMGRCGRLAVA